MHTRGYERLPESAFMKRLRVHNPKSCFPMQEITSWYQTGYLKDLQIGDAVDKRTVMAYQRAKLGEELSAKTVSTTFASCTASSDSRSRRGGPPTTPRRESEHPSDHPTACTSCGRSIEELEAMEVARSRTVTSARWTGCST